MSGLDPTEAQLAAVSLGIEEGIHGKNSTEDSYKSKEDSYIVDEKRAESPLSDDDNNGGLGPTPTEEEKQTLPHMPGPINFAAFLIAFIELAERFSYYGSTIVFTNFIQQPLPEGSTTGATKTGQAGALGMGQQASTGLTTFNQVSISLFLRLGIATDPSIRTSSGPTRCRCSAPTSPTLTWGGSTPFAGPFSLPWSATFFSSLRPPRPSLPSRTRLSDSSPSPSSSWASEPACSRPTSVP